MGVVYISGHSDDLIEIDGDLEEEFEVNDSDVNFLAFSDGSVIGIRYTDEGIWRITPTSIDRSTDYLKEFEATDGSGEDENYSDLVRLSNTDGFKWVLRGSDWSNRQGSRKTSNFYTEGA